MPGAGKQRRTLYSNDSRHYHLFVHEPPMTMADARRPVDDVAGIASRRRYFYSAPPPTPPLLAGAFIGEERRCQHSDNFSPTAT